MFKRLALSTSIAVIFMACHKDPATDPNGPPDPGDSTDTSATVELQSRIIREDLLFPWDIFYGPDDHIWMTEREGRISRVNPETGEIIPLINISDVVSRGEGGLLGIALSVPIDGVYYLFAAYNYEDGGDYKQKIVRYNYADGVVSQPVVIHDSVEGAEVHNGCRLVISNDGKLLATTGDASNTSLAQNTDSKNGKILRMNFDGSIPSDNPFPSSSVWTIGHRNPQGLVYANDTLYSSEHGPDSDDEINIIHRAGNYGWPNVKGNCDGSEQGFCDDNNVIEPLASWTPTIAVSGMEYYNNNAIPQWKNSLLVATLKDETLHQLKLNAEGNQVVEQKEFFQGDFGRLRDVCAAPDGRIFICTSNGSNDMLIEISKKQ